MRLHLLEIDAFGPFAGHESVDFDDLTASGLFLLCGPTGAGKTSVLDAVCFALFGQVPGDRDKAKRLRSDHADAGAGPRVRLEATVRGRRLRITRSPEWMRPKKRGTGEVKEHAKVLVEERVDDGWLQRSSRIDEAGDLIGSLLGLTMSQFCQVALLPQGRFETFLRCGAQERHTLLEKLFGTHRFRAVEEWLGEHRRTLAVQSGEHTDRVAGTLERVAEAGDRTRPDDLDPEGVLGWSAGLRTQTLGDLTEAVEARALADQQAKDARAALDAGRDLADLQARHQDAVRQDADLRALADSSARMGQQVERARRAAGVHPFVEIHDAALRRLEQAGEALRDARAALPGGAAEDPAYDHLDAVADCLRRRQEAATRLEDLLPLDARIVALDTDVAQIDTRLAAVDADRQRLRDETDDGARAGAAARSEHAEAMAAAARIGPLRESAARAEQVALAAGRIPGCEQQRTAAAADREAAADAAQRARETWLDLRQARLDGMAAELARDLTDDRPCPVCGSSEHPAPAADGATSVSAASEQAAEEAWHRAEERRGRLTEELGRCDRDLAALHATAGGVDAATADTRLAEARRQLAETEAAAARAESLAAALAQLEETAERSHRRRQELDAEHARLSERRTLLTEQRRHLQNQVAEATGGAGDLTRRLEEVRHEASTWARLLERLRDHAEAARAHADAVAGLHDAVADAGFVDVGAARAALMTHAELSTTETLLRRRADQAAQVRVVLDDPRMVEAAAKPAADLAALTERLEDAERLRDEAVAHERTLEHRAQRLERLHGDLQEALTAWRPVRDALAVAERMAALCAGTSADNRHKMRLSAYVLAARLEQVVAAANERLLRMSSGRYTLQHSVARGVGDRRGGLGLQVHDGWTGELRDPATLSGGETFFTSLALALGLADVVTHEAGGTEISTMFVDEGFGSLDPDTLDEVMDVLDQLRSGGRAVGIVSHVADLRARVPAHVHVRKARAGSTLSASP